MNEDDAREWLRTLPGYDIAVQQRLDSFHDLLLEENRRQNLISPSSVTAIWNRHIADSAQLLTFAPSSARSWLDIGTGAGFPGMIIACLRPELEMTLAEPRKRRVEWLEHIKSALSLSRVIVAAKRVELLESRKYAVISARAVASLPKLIEAAGRFSTRDTVWLLPKGISGAQELADLPKEQAALFHVEHSFTEANARILVGQGL